MRNINKDNLNNEDYKEIARLVESGEIYKDAREWYLSTYMLNVVERSWLIVLAIAIIFLIFTALDYYKSLLPIKSGYPILVNITDSAEEVSRLNYLGNKTKDFNINEIYIKMLSQVFVKAFENYEWRDDFKLLKINAVKVKGLGFDNVVDDYNDRISIRKLNSFILRYRKNITRAVTIDPSSVAIEKSADTQDDARKYVVSGKFSATEFEEGKRTASTWQFKIILYFRDIKYNFNEKRFDDIYYKVANYETTKLDQ